MIHTADRGDYPIVEFYESDMFKGIHVCDGKNNFLLCTACEYVTYNTSQIHIRGTHLRVPTLYEWETISNYMDEINTCLCDNGFHELSPNFYWTDTTYSSDKMVIVVPGRNKSVSTSKKTLRCYTRYIIPWVTVQSEQTDAGVHGWIPKSQFLNPQFLESLDYFL